MLKPLVCLALLAACAPPEPPVSNRGVGFGDPAEFAAAQARREAALRRAETGQGSQLPSPSGITTTELAAAGIGQGGATTGAPLTALDPNRTQGVQASTANPAPDLAGNPSISDENDFSAVTSRETIESDAARRAQQAAQRQVIAPTALPTRPSDAGPNIVEYALNAPNRKGQEWYSRSILSGQGRFERNCATYNSPDAAQRDFLARGGPERDPRGIDPDGDGFACGWDPAPFLLAAGR